MKTNVPEKLYFGESDKGILDIYSTKESDNEVEYVRTDAFIEKAIEYISEHIEYYMKKDKMCNIPLCPLFAKQSFIEDFRRYMKGE